VPDPHDPIGVAKPRGWFWWLAGRAGRREYWVDIGLLFLLSFLLSRAAPAVSAGFTVVLMSVQIRRIHDLGRTAWWAVAATIAPVVAMFAAWPVMGLEDATLAGVVVELVLIVAIGAWPGEVGENRFGPPPPFTARRVLTGR
jgi:uncharacterized membrane protein YhaH (DUF805 family)